MTRALFAFAFARAAAVGLAAMSGCGDARADEPDVALRVASELTVAVGDAAALSVTVTPSAGRTVSSDGPLRMTVDAGDGLALPRRRYARKDAADPAADAPRFDVRLKAKAPGDHPLTLDVRFWLCGPTMCRPVHLERTITVHVAAPAPPPPPPIDAGIDAAPPVDAGRRRRR